MRTRPFLALAAALTLTACDGLKEALTAHVDVAARAASQELSVERLGKLLGEARVPVEVTKENAEIIAQLWTDYQRIGLAAARGDTLADKVDMVVQPIIDNMLAGMMIDSLLKSARPDSATEAAYAQAPGGLLAARHILFGYPPAATPQQKDSVRKQAESVRGQVTAANFADMARRHSADGSAQEGGMLGVFRKGEMVPEFGNATAALRPGEISGLVESQFGIHIITRLPWSEAREMFANAYQTVSMQAADSGLQARTGAEANLTVKENGPAAVKKAVDEPEKHLEDKAVVATYKGGDFTVGEFIKWVNLLPPQVRQQVVQGLPGAPDSLVKPFIGQMALRELFLRKADSAKLQPPPDFRTAIAEQFRGAVTTAWQQLGVAPEMLADSAKSGAERERLAASRINAYLDRLLAGEVPPVQIPLPLKSVLDSKYDATVSSAGVDRAVEEARKSRAAADSARGPEQGAMPNLPPGGVPTPPPAGGGAPPTPPPGTPNP